MINSPPYVENYYKEGVSRLLANDKLQNAIELIGLVSEHKCIEAKKKLRIILEEPCAKLRTRL